MERRCFIVVAAMVAATWATTAAWAQTEGLTKDEAKCEQTSGFEQGKYASKKAGCIVKCSKDASKGKVPASDCLPPYGGGTASCNASANSKGAAKIASACSKDCPDCYEANANIGANCANVGPFFTTDQVDFFIDSIFVNPLLCDDPANWNADENKCSQAMGSGGGKMAAKFANCYKKCRASVEKGTASGDCGAPATDANGVGLAGKDSALVACTAKEIAKLRDTHSKKCADEPDCWQDFPLTQNMPDNFIGTINQVFGVADSATYCGP
jgi:hypothetical protein